MTQYTSDASSIYRDTTGVLVARDDVSAAPIGTVRETSAAAHADDCFDGPMAFTVYSEELSPAIPFALA